MFQLSYEPYSELFCRNDFQLIDNACMKIFYNNVQRILELIKTFKVECAELALDF